LDVLDDNPPPKGSGPLFNRSILILTPERPLKFTALSLERHNIWLAALSFLAHSPTVSEASQITQPLTPKSVSLDEDTGMRRNNSVESGPFYISHFWYDEESTTIGEGGSMRTIGERGSVAESYDGSTTETDNGSTTAGEDEYDHKTFRHGRFRRV
jgi:Meiotic cell cortex C-terminal pleckstrin homology